MSNDLYSSASGNVLGTGGSRANKNRIAKFFDKKYPELPTGVRECMVLDFLSQHELKKRRRELINNGMSKYEATQIVFPVPGCRSFTDVYLAMRDVRRGNPPSILDFGSAGMPMSPSFIRSMMERSFALTLLGVDNANGGGPGVMELSSTLHQFTTWVVGQTSFAKNWIPPVVAQILLHIAKERPNGYGSEGMVAFPQDNLVSRESQLVYLGNRVLSYTWPGGLGTEKEHFGLGVSMQLNNDVRTPVCSTERMVVVDYNLRRGGAFRDGLYLQLNTMAEEKTIRPEDIQIFTRVNIDEPGGTRRLVTEFLYAAEPRFGNLRAKWEVANECDFFETVDHLYDRYSCSVGYFIELWRKSHGLPPEHTAVSQSIIDEFPPSGNALAMVG